MGTRMKSTWDEKLGDAIIVVFMCCVIVWMVFK